MDELPAALGLGATPILADEMPVLTDWQAALATGDDD